MSRGVRASNAKSFFRKKPVRIAMRMLKATMKCILTIFLIGTITVSIFGCVMIVYVVTNYKGTEGIPDLRNININQSSIIYCKNANGEFVENQHVQGANSIWKDLNKIPINMQNAVIAIEDERFREHYGVDWKRTVSAIANLVFKFSSHEYGGSTITQQLIKNLTKDDDVRISRKIREIFRAIEMERSSYTKDQILEAYLNILPLGSVSGVGAAANYFFAKDVEDLTIAECAVIAGITQSPSMYNPYMHPDNIKRRQRHVLNKMYELGFITVDEYKQAYNQELIFKSSMRRVDVQDYYADLLTEQVIEDLMKTYGYSSEWATQIFFRGGLKIYSAKDPEQQRKVEQIFENDKNFPKHNKNDKEDPQAGIAIIDYNGRLVATVGGRGEKTANRVFNRAVDATRQPGSSIKPLAVYTPAIDLNLIHYSTIVKDNKITLRDGTKWPNNYGNYKYGAMPVEEALQRSLNTVPAQLMEIITPQRSFDFVTQRLHLSTLVKSARVNDQISTDIDFAPMTLGGLTYGVKCIEMAAAFQIFGNGGVYNKPYTYYKVERDGEVLLETKPLNDKVISEDTAYVMNRLLQRVVVGPHGTGKGQKIGSFETFGKTGTTNDDKDVYFVGGTPYYVGACWFGYDNNQRLRVTTYARSLWKKSMDALHSGLSKKTFDKKGNTIEATYCYQTGLLASKNCKNRAIGVYKPDNVPDYCHVHGGGSIVTNPATTQSTDKATTTSSSTITSQTSALTITAPVS